MRAYQQTAGGKQYEKSKEDPKGRHYVLKNDCTDTEHYVPYSGGKKYQTKKIESLVQ